MIFEEKRFGNLLDSKIDNGENSPLKYETEFLMIHPVSQSFCFIANH